MTEDYSRLAAELAGSIRLGYEVEEEDSAAGFEMPTDEEIRWLADWLVSKGWTPTGRLAPPRADSRPH